MLQETIDPVITEAQKAFLADPKAIALNAAHSLAFHRGLGNALYPSSLASYHVQAAEVEAYGAVAYSKPNFALVGSGIDKAELTKWAVEFFSSVSATAPSGLPSLETPATKYYGGEERIYNPKKNAIVLAFPGSGLANGTGFKPEFEVLSTLLGGTPSVKWSSASSILGKAIASHTGVKVNTDLAKYSDSGLLYVTLSGPTKAIGAAAKDVVAAIKSLSSGSISKDDFKKAAAQAKFKVSNAETADAPSVDLIGLSAITGKLQTPEESLKGVSSVSEAAVSAVSISFLHLVHSSTNSYQAAKKLFSGKVSVATVGELQDLPFAEDLGLNV
jgi:ubiquinol-cytochrome c reductase core subunit 2